MAPINLLRLGKICEDKVELLKHLQSWKLIPVQGTYQCPKCGGPLTLTEDCSRPDGWRWRCCNKVVRHKKAQPCETTVEFRHGTFFSQSKLTMIQMLGFVNLWVSNVPLVTIREQLEISSNHTGVDWASFCREVLLDAFISKKEKIGGVGKVVEIDESKFGKRKYHRGHYVEGQWVFGAYERGSGRVFMVAVENRGSETLLAIIKEWIEDGTTILSDYWKAYDCLDNEGYIHHKVNHSLHFKDPITEVHTNAIESSWRAAKAVICPSGRKRAHIPGNLAKYMFFKRCEELGLNRTEEFFRLAGELYNPCKLDIEPSDDIDEEDID